VDEALNEQITAMTKNGIEQLPDSSSSTPTPSETPIAVQKSTPPQPVQLSDDEVLEKISMMEPLASSEAVVQSENLYCPECYLPLHPDPKPERLYIFLHALRYTTSLGSFETEMPDWAADGWTWDRS
jgi:tRNA pseudouridine synthase 9